MSLPQLLAWRYITAGTRNSNIKTMLTICYTGICIGTLALTLTLIITRGFEKSIHTKISGINAPAIIESPGQKIDDVALKNYLTKKFGRVIKDMSSSCVGQMIINEGHAPSVVFLRGIESEHERNVTGLEEKIVKNQSGIQPNLIALLSTGGIIIGHKIATRHNIKPGDTINIAIPHQVARKGRINLEKKELVVAGIFDVGLNEYDSNIAYIELSAFKELMESEKGVDSISISFKPQEHAPIITRIKPIDHVIHMIRQAIPFTAVDYEQSIVDDMKTKLPEVHVATWQELYPSIISSLRLEKYAMFFVIALIALVAFMNMIALLFMKIQQKRRDIAILQTMGMNFSDITSLFTTLGMIITLGATSLGLILGAIIGYVLEYHPFIKLPDVYFVEYLPACLEPEVFIATFACTTLLGWLATRRAVASLKDINIAEVLRQES